MVTNHDNSPQKSPPTAGHRVWHLFLAMRPVQWSKNLLLAVPIITGHAWDQPEKLLSLVMAFIAFSLAASGVYLVNDILDVRDDRRHPVKCKRPIAAGLVSIPIALATAVVLIAAALYIGMQMRGHFLQLLGAYLIITTSYSLYFKRKPILDAIFLAGLYTLRIIIGGEAVNLFPTPWLLAFGMFIFLSLALAKRHAELTLMQRNGQQPPDGRGYKLADVALLLMAGLASGYAGVLVFAMYINSLTAVDLYEMPGLLWLICPLLVYWITRLWLLANRGDLRDDPLMFTLTDRVSWFVGLCMLAIIYIATG